MASDTPPSDSKWSKELNKAFEDSLTVHYNDDNRCSKNARAVPEKTVEHLKLRHKDLQDDVVGIVSDKAPLPRCTSSGSSKNKNQNMKKSPRKRNIRKGLLWTENEHRLFLYGLEKCGRGDWKSISRYYVKSKTNSQVASHAQKFFNRLNSQKAGKRSSINDITVAYPLESPTDTKSEEASSDPSKQPTLPSSHVETKAGREKIVNPGPSETKLPTHGARVPCDDNLSSHDLDFVGQMIVDPDTPNQSPKRDITAPIMHYELPTNDTCIPEYSNKSISDLGFASSHSVVACRPSTAQVLSFDPMAPASVAQVPGFTSHTVMDSSPSLAQVKFTSHKGAHHVPSTVQLPTFDKYAPEPANEPRKYLDFTDQMIRDSGPSNTELRAFDIGVPFPSNQSIRKSNFTSQVTMNLRNSTVEFPYKTCVPALTNQPIQGLDFASHMISNTISSTAPSPAFNARAPSFTDGPMHDLDLANICLPETTSQPIQDTDFVTGMIIDPEFSISQLSTCDDFDLSFLNEPIEDADLTSRMVKDPHPSADQLQNRDDFAPIPENQVARGLESSTKMLSTIDPLMGDYTESPTDSFDIASAFEMVSLDEFMLLDI